VARYEQPTLHRSAWQMVNTLAGYAGLWAAMYFSLPISYWLTLALAIPTAGFLVRLFVIFHDCGHGSFFRSRKANDTLGVLAGILVFTPYSYWRHNHALHHATAGDLDRRGTGDVWTLTVEEYLAAPRWKRCAYRLMRNPVVLFGIAPVLLLVILQRFPQHLAKWREWRGVLPTNVGVLAVAAILAWLVGIRAYLLIQLPVLMVASSVGVWLFYVQHQFEGTYWQRRDRWSYVEAALQGSSFYQLPRVLQWFTGNIGFHHIHHLSPGIPNYNLEQCHRADPLFQQVPRITLGASAKAMTYRLWDEQDHRLIGFRGLRARRHPRRNG
jgi:acyl-lipid omega-6 desaturase (Delta-12 desaturase)